MLTVYRVETKDGQGPFRGRTGDYWQRDYDYYFEHIQFYSREFSWYVPENFVFGFDSLAQCLKYFCPENIEGLYDAGFKVTRYRISRKHIRKCQLDSQIVFNRDYAKKVNTVSLNQFRKLTKMEEFYADARNGGLSSCDSGDSSSDEDGPQEVSGLSGDDGYSRYLNPKLPAVRDIRRYGVGNYSGFVFQSVSDPFTEALRIQAFDIETIPFRVAGVSSGLVGGDYSRLEERVIAYLSGNQGDAKPCKIFPTLNSLSDSSESLTASILSTIPKTNASAASMLTSTKSTNEQINSDTSPTNSVMSGKYLNNSNEMAEAIAKTLRLLSTTNLHVTQKYLIAPS